ncbi:MAG: bacillithiol biosynthesis deacetylase BshB1, partial [Verrucomicrobia bacterium]|nr:bacillithiol biosynthesis deacetylase BshB1 [Verrucomicrobiota bacterium]
MKLDILAFGAHPDDVEISAGATLLKYSQQGKKIGIIDLTLGELSTRGNVDLRKQEAQKASEFLRLSVRENLELKDGFFSENEDTLRLIISKIRQYQPTIIMANSLSDRHPDHGCAAQLLGNAAYYSGLLKIQTQVNGSKQMPWRPKIVLHYIQDFHREPDLLLDVTGFEKDKVEL